MSKWKTILKLIVIVCLMAAIGASVLRLVHQMHQDKYETVTVWEQERSVLHLPLYIALREGFFDEQKIRVRIITPTEAAETASGPNPYAQPVCDIILADPADACYHLAVQHPSPQIIAALTRGDGSYLVRSNEQKQTSFQWQDLKGQRIICYPPETGSGAALDSLLRKNGLRPQHDVSLYHRIPADLQLAVFKAGSAPYIQLPGPLAIRQEKEKTGHIVARIGESGTAFPSVLCLAWPAGIQQKPAAVQAFVSGMYKALLWLEHEPEIAAGAVRDYLTPLVCQGETIEPADTKDVIKAYAKAGIWAPQPTIDEELLAAYIQSLITAGIQPSPIAFTESVDNGFAQAAVNAVQYTPPKEQNPLRAFFSRLKPD